MDPLRERFTDAEVRRDPALLTTAVAYALAYEGDFQFMRDARSYAERNGTLSVLIARGVLNCAIRDPEWADQLPAPRPRPRPRLEVVPEMPEEPDPHRLVDLKPEWKFQFFRTQADYPAAPIRPYHFLDVENSYLRWTPGSESAYYRLSSRCGQKASNSGWRYGKGLLIFTANEIPEGFRFCLQCERLIRKDQIDAETAEVVMNRIRLGGAS